MQETAPQLQFEIVVNAKMVVTVPKTLQKKVKGREFKVGAVKVRGPGLVRFIETVPAQASVGCECISFPLRNAFKITLTIIQTFL